MKKSPEDKMRFESIYLLYFVMILMLFGLICSCNKAEDCTIVCKIVPLPDTLEAGVPFKVDATPSIDESTCTLASFFTVQELYVPVTTHTEHFGLSTDFTVYKKGWNTIRVTVYKAENEWSDNIKQDIYFQ